MKILILGDVHGEWAELNIVMAKAMRLYPDITAFVQVGDFGYAWPGCKPFTFLKTFWENADMERAQSLPFYWLDGNHENHDQLDADQGGYQAPLIYQSRGSIRELGDKRAMFFGGASSIDKQYRIEGRSWWQQESIKYGQILSALENYYKYLIQNGPIDIVFSHEHPFAFPYKSYKDNFGKGDKDMLDALRQELKPKWWFFGHHHAFGEGETRGTKWACAPIIDSRQAILWDGDSLTRINFGKDRSIL